MLFGSRFAVSGGHLNQGFAMLRYDNGDMNVLQQQSLNSIVLVILNFPLQSYTNPAVYKSSVWHRPLQSLNCRIITVITRDTFRAEPGDDYRVPLSSGDG